VTHSRTVLDGGWERMGLWAISKGDYWISKQVVESKWVYCLWHREGGRNEKAKCLWVGTLEECKAKAV